VAPRDDLGSPFPRRGIARRVVSLVPSLTEAMASVRPGALVGVTDWCTHPPDLDAARVRGTKNPDLGQIALLRPDVVVANKEENRELDVRRLRAAGVPVWVTEITTVPQAIDSMSRLFYDALGWPRPAWLGAARRRWRGPLPPVTARVVVPVWRDPWMVVGRDTFTGDLLRRLGWQNVFDDSSERYPHVEIDELDSAGADLVLLPDEPYVFAEDDGPEAFTRTPTMLVSGRDLTWYGPSLVETVTELHPRAVLNRLRSC
jgi:ABC-type Fe3+-hydroxamate transport system substrate-binding protein